MNISNSPYIYSFIFYEKLNCLTSKIGKNLIIRNPNKKHSFSSFELQARQFDLEMNERIVNRRVGRVKW